MHEIAGDDGPGRRPVLIEFSERPGLRPVSLTAPEAVRRSGEVLDEAMDVMRAMADRVGETVESMAERPLNVELSFGIKFDAQVGAIIAKTGMEASFNVTLSWASR